MSRMRLRRSRRVDWRKRMRIFALDALKVAGVTPLVRYIRLPAQRKNLRERRCAVVPPNVVTL